ncbi:MAG TPA: FAD-binding oxidoreductase [Bryobacteraceae bacterium]|nr:FAD-binding oxidoreductase [Bryobacteraceae bacterium]
MPAVSADELRVRLRGEVIQPEDAAYESARKVYNGMIDKRPRMIVKCADVADVIQAVLFARNADMLVAVRGGGHNGAGLAICDNGLVIDLSRMRSTHVDPVARTMQVEGGCTWNDVDHAGHAFGLTTPAGTISTTGVGGLTLGGGIGHLTRRYGLTIDNLLAADVVLADGTFVTASATDHADLYWAVRGGGGNFGVVTSFLFRLHPVKIVQAGPTFWPIDKAPDVLRFYSQFITAAPEEVNGFFAFLTVPPAPMFPKELHLKKMCGVFWCSTLAPEQTDKALQAMRQFGKPVFDHVGPMPFPVLQSLFDGLYPPGLQWYWKGDFFKEFSSKAIDLHAEHGSRLPTMHSTAHFYPIDGAAGRVGSGDTAFQFRDAKWAGVIVGVDPDPANKEKITSWARSYWEALHPYSAGGAYVNFMMDEGQDRVKATYGKNYKRLAAIKKTHDPANFFRVNQNIRPEA